jgi:hypothetical protein
LTSALSAAVVLATELAGSVLTVGAGAVIVTGVVSRVGRTVYSLAVAPALLK